MRGFRARGLYSIPLAAQSAAAAASSRVKKRPSRTNPATTEGFSSVISPAMLRSAAHSSGRQLSTCMGAGFPGVKQAISTRPVRVSWKAGTNRALRACSLTPAVPAKARFSDRRRFSFIERVMIDGGGRFTTEAMLLLRLELGAFSTPVNPRLQAG